LPNDGPRTRTVGELQPGDRIHFRGGVWSVHRIEPLAAVRAYLYLQIEEGGTRRQVRVQPRLDQRVRLA
jgi:hypothetical protein